MAASRLYRRAHAKVRKNTFTSLAFGSGSASFNWRDQTIHRTRCAKNGTAFATFAEPLLR